MRFRPIRFDNGLHAYGFPARTFYPGSPHTLCGDSDRLITVLGPFLRIGRFERAFRPTGYDPVDMDKIYEARMDASGKWASIKDFLSRGRERRKRPLTEKELRGLRRTCIWMGFGMPFHFRKADMNTSRARPLMESNP